MLRYSQIFSDILKYSQIFSDIIFTISGELVETTLTVVRTRVALAGVVLGKAVESHEELQSQKRTGANRILTFLSDFHYSHSEVTSTKD